MSLSLFNENVHPFNNPIDFVAAGTSVLCPEPTPLPYFWQSKTVESSWWGTPPQYRCTHGQYGTSTDTKVAQHLTKLHDWSLELPQYYVPQLLNVASSAVQGDYVLCVREDNKVSHYIINRELHGYRIGQLIPL